MILSGRDMVQDEARSKGRQPIHDIPQVGLNSQHCKKHHGE